VVSFMPKTSKYLILVNKKMFSECMKIDLRDMLNFHLYLNNLYTFLKRESFKYVTSSLHIITTPNFVKSVL